MPYSLARINETLYCLNGAKVFTTLHLKLGYWQVGLDEASKPLTVFTVDPLGFYKCQKNAIWANQYTSNFPKTQRILFRCPPSQLV